MLIQSWGWGKKYWASNQDVTLLASSPHPEAIEGPTHKGLTHLNKKLSHLSLRKFQGFYEFRFQAPGWRIKIKYLSGIPQLRTNPLNYLTVSKVKYWAISVYTYTHHVCCYSSWPSICNSLPSALPWPNCVQTSFFPTGPWNSAYPQPWARTEMQNMPPHQSSQIGWPNRYVSYQVASLILFTHFWFVQLPFISFR